MLTVISLLFNLGTIGVSIGVSLKALTILFPVDSAQKQDDKSVMQPLVGKSGRCYQPQVDFQQ